MIKILEDIDINALLDCYQMISDSVEWFDYEKGRQAGLQYRIGENPWLSAVGKGKGDDLSIKEINPQIKGTEFEKIINKFNLSRTRLLWVKPFVCYSMHRDTSPRIHIPLITNKDCYFVFKYSIPAHLSVGHVYQVDTRNFHTFVNCSEHHRLHIVGAVEN